MPESYFSSEFVIDWVVLYILSNDFFTLKESDCYWYYSIIIFWGTYLGSLIYSSNSATYLIVCSIGVARLMLFV